MANGGADVKAYLPVASVLVAILVLWYGATVWLNSQWVYDQAARDGVQVSFAEMIPATMAQQRPVLPAPHQVAAELFATTIYAHDDK